MPDKFNWPRKQDNGGPWGPRDASSISTLSTILRPVALFATLLVLSTAALFVIADKLRVPDKPADGSSSMYVASNAALKEMPAGTAGTIRRAGFSSSGDGGAAIYHWSASSCSLNNGNGDDGAQVRPTAGRGCWVADLSQPMDVRVWGARCDGVTDDTVALNRALAAAATVAIPPLTCVGKNISWQTTGASSVVGTPNKSILKLAPDAKVDVDYLAWYFGSGPINISGVTFQCPIYNFAKPAAPPGKWGLMIEPSDSKTQIKQVNLRDVAGIGCHQQFIVLRVSYVDIDHMFLDRPYSMGLNLGQNGNSEGDPPYNSSHIRLNNISGRGAGSYCAGFLGAEQPPAGKPTPGTVDFQAHNLTCNGAGLLAGTSKACFDLNGTSYDKVVFQGTGMNCWGGGIEAKSGNEVPLMRPNFAGNVNLKFTYFSNFDLGYAVMLPIQALEPGRPTPHRLMLVEAHATFEHPEPWTSKFPYLVGSVISANGNTYYALSEGVSASNGSGPSCSGPNPTTCQDGAVWWLYVQETPKGPAQQLVALDIEAVTDVTAHVYAQQTAYGVQLAPRGNQPMSRVQLHFDGTTTKGCLVDALTGTGEKIGTIDRLTIKDFNCRTTGGWAAIQIGYNNGTYVNNYTNLIIDGGVFWADGDEFAFKTTIPATVKAGQTPAIKADIIGAPIFKGGRGAFFIDNSVDLTFAPGATLEVACPTKCSTRSPIYGSSKASGTLRFMGPTHVKTFVPPDNRFFATVTQEPGSGVNVFGDFIRGFSDSTPFAQAGSPGDKVLIKVPVPSVPNGWSCTRAGNPCEWTPY